MQKNFFLLFRNEDWIVKHKIDLDCYAVLLPQPLSTRPLIAKATNGRPMSIKMSGHGFVSNAENTAIVQYSTNKNANQQRSAIFNPATALVALRREISHARV